MKKMPNFIFITLDSNHPHFFPTAASPKQPPFLEGTARWSTASRIQATNEKHHPNRDLESQVGRGLFLVDFATTKGGGLFFGGQAQQIMTSQKKGR